MSRVSKPIFDSCLVLNTLKSYKSTKGLCTGVRKIGAAIMDT